MKRLRQIIICDQVTANELNTKDFNGRGRVIKSLVKGYYALWIN